MPPVLDAVADRISTALSGTASTSSNGLLHGLQSALSGVSLLSASLYCIVLCCLCGYGTFCYLAYQHSPRSTGGRPGRLRERIKEAVQQAALTHESISEAEKVTAPATPAPETPAASTRGEAIHARLSSDDGRGSQDPIRAPEVQQRAVMAGPEVVMLPHSLIDSVDGTRMALEAPVEDGEHNFVWEDGSEYFGEWANGKAHGRGVFCWPNGERYEGNWKEGKEDGVGTAIAGDGSTFYGFWADGKMNGEGMYKPATPSNHRQDVMFMREYIDGQLNKETVLRVADYDMRKKQLKLDHKMKYAEKRQAAKDMREATRPGETIYKGHRSYDLMRNLQMGILFSIAKINKEVGDRDEEPTPPDFKLQVTQQFPRSGQSTSFKWKDYTPFVFHRLREAFGIDNRDYLLSLTGDKALRELPSPGKSGSVFFLSDDDRFMIKTVRKEEMRLLLELIPEYYAHCHNNPDTLLTRFYGVYRVKPINGLKVRFVVMGNVFPTDVRLHRKFDLKGSTHGRTAGPRAAEPGATLKDLDVDMQLEVTKHNYSMLMAQIRADAGLLEKLHVMDYSLLLGVHYVNWGVSSWHLPGSDDDAVAPQSPTVNGREGGSPRGMQDTQQLWKSLYDNQDHVPSANHSWHTADQPDEAQAYNGGAGEGSQLSSGSSLLAGAQEQRFCNSTLSTPTTTMGTPLRDGGSLKWGVDRAQISPDDINRRLLAVGKGAESRPVSLDVSETGSSEAESLKAGRVLRSLESIASTASARSAEKRSSPFAAALPPSTLGPMRHPFRDALVTGASTAAEDGPSPAAEEGQGVVRRPKDPPHIRFSDAQEALPPVQERRQGSPGTPMSMRRSVDGLMPTPSLRALQTFAYGDGDRAKQSLDLGRTKSGHVRTDREVTSLRRLHSEARINQMGFSIPAHAVRKDDPSAKPEPVLLYFGIIDFLQDYNLRKRTEHLFKSVYRDSRAISVISPHSYSQRFCKFMHSLFVPQSS